MYRHKKIMAIVAMVTIICFGNVQIVLANGWISNIRGPAIVALSPGAVGYFNVAGQWVSTALVDVAAGASGIAFAPAVAAGMVITAAGAAGYLIYKYQKDQAKWVNDMNQVELAGAGVEYVDLNMMDVVLTGGSAKVNFQDVKNAVIANPAKYPNMAQGDTRNLPAGVVRAPNGNAYSTYVETSVGNYYWTPEAGWGGLPSADNVPPADTVQIVDLEYLGPRYHKLQVTVTHYQYWGSMTQTLTAQSLKKTSSDNHIQDQYSGEIDDCIKDAPNIVHFDDLPADTHVADGSSISAIGAARNAAQQAASDALASASAAAQHSAAAAGSVTAAEAANISAQNANVAAQAAVTTAQAAVASATTQAQISAAQAQLATALQQQAVTQAAADAAARAADSALIAAVSGNGAAQAQALADIALAERALADAQIATSGDMKAGLLKDNKVGSDDDQGDGIIGWLRQIRDAVKSGFNTVIETLTKFAGNDINGSVPDDENTTLSERDKKYNVEIDGVPPPSNGQPTNQNSKVPDKKDIKAMLQEYIQSSPLATLLHDIRINVSEGSTVVGCTFYGHRVEADWKDGTESTFRQVGTIMLAFAHVTAVLLIFRREGDH